MDKYKLLFNEGLKIFTVFILICFLRTLSKVYLISTYTKVLFLF